MQRKVEVRFSEYYERWISSLGANLPQLVSVPRDSSKEKEQKQVVFKVLQLYKQYYIVKWAGAREDVLCFFSPSWLTPLENAHAWVTGWKPSMAYKIINLLRSSLLPGSSLVYLTEDQLKKIEGLRMITSLEEQKVEREMERQQVSLADRKIVELARLTSRGKGHMEVSVEVNDMVKEAMNGLLAGLVRVMKTADCVRLKAMKEILEVLTPLQCVDYMAAFLMIQLQLRNSGKIRALHSRLAI